MLLKTLIYPLYWRKSMMTAITLYERLITSEAINYWMDGLIDIYDDLLHNILAKLTKIDWRSIRNIGRLIMINFSNRQTALVTMLCLQCEVKWRAVRWIFNALHWHKTIETFQESNKTCSKVLTVIKYILLSFYINCM